MAEEQTLQPDNPGARWWRLGGRRTNLALLFLLFSALLTGAVTQALGTPRVGRWMTWAHGVAGVAVLVMTPWKTAVARRGLTRKNRHRAMSLLLALQVVVVIATGFIHTTGLVRNVGPFTVLWVHVAVALSLVPVSVWHIVARKTWPRRIDINRRNFLRTAGLVSTAAVIWWTADRAIAAARLPGADRRFTGSHERSSFDVSELPVTSWLDDRVPTIDGNTWRLQMTDAGGERLLSLAEIEAFADEEIIAVLDCTGGWYSRQVWEGIRLDRLVAPGGARSVLATSTTGYARRYPIGDLSGLWLATRVGGESLTPGHGFPARVVSPSRRGFWWVKWVSRLETSDLPWWVQSPYPLT